MVASTDLEVAHSPRSSASGVQQAEALPQRAGFSLTPESEDSPSPNDAKVKDYHTPEETSPATGMRAVSMTLPT
jgi:hypothetical protein